MNLKTFAITCLISVFNLSILHGQTYADSISWVHGSKYSTLEIEVGGEMFPTYTYRNILEHTGDYQQLPKTIRQSSSDADLLPYAFGTIRRYQLSDTSYVSISNSTGNFLVEEIDPHILLVTFSDPNIQTNSLPILTSFNYSLSSEIITQAAILPIDRPGSEHRFIVQVHRKNGDIATDADNYSLNLLVYKPY